MRTSLVALVVVTGFIVAGPPTILLSWLTGSSRVLFGIAVPWIRFTLWVAGVRFGVVGLDRLDPAINYLFMPNHQSNVDPPLVLVALRRNGRFMAKASLFRIPLLGQVLHAGGFVPVVREDRRQAIESVKVAAAKLRSGLDFIVFPEGTRSRDGNLLELKKGPFFMALAGGVPVVPVAINGSQQIMPRGGWLIRGGDISVQVLEPISGADLDGGDDNLREQLRAQVAAALQAGLTDNAARVTPSVSDHD